MSLQHEAPRVLTVIMVDTTATYIAARFDDERIPYGRRTVQIELTPEQREKLLPRQTGVIKGRTQYEAVLTAWLEPLEDADDDR